RYAVSNILPELNQVSTMAPDRSAGVPVALAAGVSPAATRTRRPRDSRQDVSTTVAILMLVAFSTIATAQIPSEQAAVSAKESSKASLQGNVTKEPGGEPLKKAIVELIAENQEEGGNYTATSGPEGQFKIEGIAPGRYKMFVERPGFLEVDAKHKRS